MTTLPKVLPPLPREQSWNRDLPAIAAVGWLVKGWNDFRIQTVTSLAYGAMTYLISVAIVGGLIATGKDYILFPALAAFMVVGPIVAIGLYEKSRRIAEGQKVGLMRMIFVVPAAGAQILFTGVLLCLLALLWMRAAVIIYALFFGLRPFPGLANLAPMLFATPTGWAMLLVGSAVGALFAAFGFSISVFSIPMLLDKRIDALTAMGTSMALVWNNLGAMLAWGAIVLALFIVCIATGLIGLVVVFPLVGHGTWHAYQTMRP